MGAHKPYLKRKNSITLRDLFTQDPKCKNVLTGATQLPRPPFVEPETDKMLQIIPKCNPIFTFVDPAESSADQEEKYQHLSQILTFVSTGTQQLESQILSPLISMISINIFQPLPVPTNQYLPFDPLEDELPVLTPLPSWPHLELIYDILSSLISNTDIKALKRNQLNRAFLLNLLVRFQSEDPRERVKLWNNENFIRLASNVMKEILPTVVLGIESNLSMHWSKSVQQVTTSVKTLLKEMYPDLYLKCIQQLKLQKIQMQEKETKRKLQWQWLEMAKGHKAESKTRRDTLLQLLSTPRHTFECRL